MLKKLIPEHIDNSWKGSRLTLWVFSVITVITIGRSMVHMFAPDGGAQSIATIPLDSFTPQGAHTVILIFSLWGLSQLLMGLMYAVVIWRYRALIPLMYVFIFLEYVLRIFLGFIKPIETRSIAPGAAGNYIMAPLALVMLVMCLISLETKEKGTD